MAGLGEDKGLGSSASQWKPVLILSPAHKSQPVGCRPEQTFSHHFSAPDLTFAWQKTLPESSQDI